MCAIGSDNNIVTVLKLAMISSISFFFIKFWFIAKAANNIYSLDKSPKYNFLNISIIL